jgi:hypothetical protein
MSRQPLSRSVEKGCQMEIGERRRSIFIEPIETPIEEPTAPDPSEPPAREEPERVG